MLGHRLGIEVAVVHPKAPPGVRGTSPDHAFRVSRAAHELAHAHEHAHAHATRVPRSVARNPKLPDSLAPFVGNLSLGLGNHGAHCASRPTSRRSGGQRRRPHFALDPMVGQQLGLDLLGHAAARRHRGQCPSPESRPSCDRGSVGRSHGAYMRMPRLYCAHSLCIGREESRELECHSEDRPRTRQARRRAVRRLPLPDPPGTSTSVPVSF